MGNPKGGGTNRKTAAFEWRASHQLLLPMTAAMPAAVSLAARHVTAWLTMRMVRMSAGVGSQPEATDRMMAAT